MDGIDDADMVDLTAAQVAERYLLEYCRYSAGRRKDLNEWGCELVISEAEEGEAISCSWMPAGKRTSGERRDKLCFILAHGWMEKILRLGFMGIGKELILDAVEQKPKHGMDKVWKVSVAGRSRGRSVSIHHLWCVQLGNDRKTGYTLSGTVKAILRPYIVSLTGST